MSRLATVLAASVIALGLGGAASAQTTAKTDKAALKEAVVSCKAEAKGKKVAWLKRREGVDAFDIRTNFNPFRLRSLSPANKLETP